MEIRSSSCEDSASADQRLSWRSPVVLISEETIIQSLKAGDASALVALYDSYGDAMYGLALRILRQPPEAEDVVQEVLMTLWSHCAYDPLRGSLRSFLLLSVRSRSLDRIRKRQGQARTVQRWGRGELGELDSHEPFDNAIRNETVIRVQAALNQLPEHQRQVLEYSYYEGLTQVQIAQRLEVPLGTVKSWFRLAFTKLRRELHDLTS